jgi:hypothetical protein
MKKAMIYCLAFGFALGIFTNTFAAKSITDSSEMISSIAAVYKLYDGSSGPKLYKELKGSDHYPALFDIKQKEVAIQLIIDFVQN